MSLAQFSLQGKKALVVGGRRNMGKGFALGLAEAGADVAVADLQIDDGRLQAVADEITDMGRRGLAVQVDISSKTSVDELVANVVESLGGIDILMNVAVMYHRKSHTGSRLVLKHQRSNTGTLLLLSVQFRTHGNLESDS